MREAPPTPSRFRLTPRAYRRLLIAAVLFGVTCRAVQYAWNRSAWHDEAAMALNLVHWRSVGLAPRLVYRQPAPWLWLWIERGVTAALGTSEPSLRLWPLVASVATMVFFALLATRALGHGTALIAVVLFAASDRLIWYAAEARHYASDVLVTVAVLLVAVTVWRRRGPLRALAWAALVAVPGVLISYPAVFVFGGVSVAVLLGLPAECRASDSRSSVARRLAIWAGLNAVVAAVFGFLFLAYTAGQATPLVTGSWTDEFPDLTRPLTVPAWLVRSSVSLWNTAHAPLGGVLLALAAVGAVVLWRRRCRRVVAITLFPFVLTVAASALHRYPYGGGRAILFAVPLALLLSAAGLAWCTAALARRARWLAVVLCAVVLAPGVGLAGYHLVRPRVRHHLRPVARAVFEQIESGDVVWVICYHEFDYERHRAGHLVVRSSGPDHAGPGWSAVVETPDHIRYRVRVPLKPGPGMLDEIETPPGGRLWVVWTGGDSARRRDVDPLLGGLSARARESAVVAAHGSGAHLFIFPDRPSGRE